MMILKDRILFLADTTVNLNPTAELAEIAVMSADAARYFEIEPRVAFVIYSTSAPWSTPTSSGSRKPWSWPARRGPT